MHIASYERIDKKDFMLLVRVAIVPKGLVLIWAPSCFSEYLPHRRNPICRLNLFANRGGIDFFGG